MSIAKRSVTIRGHRTSVSLEPAFFQELERVADERNLPLGTLITRIDEERDPDTNLSSALRLFVLSELRALRD